MSVKYKKSEYEKFCYTDLCNTPAKASELIKNKCEGDNNSIDSKQLIYSRQILNPNSTNKVTECNFCSNLCSFDDIGPVQKCRPKHTGCSVKKLFFLCLIMILKTNFYLILVCYCVI